MARPLTVGDRIRQARRNRKLNRNQLARSLTMSWSAIDHWESGQSVPDPLSLARLARTLGVSVDHLLGIETSRPIAAVSFARFLRTYAPKDLTDAERAWLRRAPAVPGSLTAEDYAEMLAALRENCGASRTKRSR